MSRQVFPTHLCQRVFSIQLVGNKPMGLNGFPRAAYSARFTSRIVIARLRLGLVNARTKAYRTTVPKLIFDLYRLVL